MSWAGLGWAGGGTAAEKLQTNLRAPAGVRILGCCWGLTFSDGDLAYDTMYIVGLAESP